MRTVGNIVTEYNDLMYDSRPVKFDEFMTDKYNKVHNELYNDALSKYLNKGILRKIDPNFMYELFRTMTDNSKTFETFFEAYKKLASDNHLKATLIELSIYEYDFLKKVFEKTCELLDSIREQISTGHIINASPDITNLSDFRIIYANNQQYLEQEVPGDGDSFITFFYDIDEDTNDIVSREKYMLASEMFDYVFILESDAGTRLAYNRKGEWLLILDGDKWTSDSHKFYIINYIDECYKELVRFITELLIRIYKDSHRIIEIKNNEYWQPSSIIVISKNRPYKKDIIDLTRYWNMSQAFSDVSPTDVKMIDEDLNDSELIELNYIKGIAKMRSRMSNIEYDVPFRYLNDNVKVSKELTLEGTFRNLTGV